MPTPNAALLKSNIPIVHLGKSGLQVSRYGFGSWVTFKNQVGDDLGYNLMVKAFRAGINFFDNAEIYAAGESEKIMGNSIKRGIAEGVWRRQDLVVTTKVFFGDGKDNSVNRRGLSRKHIVEGTLASLERMQLDYVDVLYCHRPDPFTPIEETVRAMNHIIDRGLAFYWGTSEWSATQLMEAMGVCDRLGLIRPITEQSEFSLVRRDRLEREHLPLYERFGMGNTIWSPLGSGVLTGKYANGIPDDSRLALPSMQWLKDRVLGENGCKVAMAERLRPVAERVGCSLTQLALAWVLKHDNATVVLIGASSEAQLDENIAAFEHVDKLTPEVMAEIDAICANKPEVDPITSQVTDLRLPYNQRDHSD